MLLKVVYPSVISTVTERAVVFVACDVLPTTAAWWHCFLPTSASGLLMKEPQVNTHVRTYVFNSQ